MRVVHWTGLGGSTVLTLTGFIQELADAITDYQVRPA